MNNVKVQLTRASKPKTRSPSTALVTRILTRPSHDSTMT